MTVCSRCIFDDSIPGITFDEKGICSYCKLHENMVAMYPSGHIGVKKLAQLGKKIKRAGRGKVFDVVVGLSGGSDSCFVLHLAKQLGLRVLAVNFDNGWGSNVALRNMLKVCSQAGATLKIHKVSAKEMRTIYKAFLWVGSPDLEASSDIGLAATLFREAEKYGIQYIFEGHNFRTEGVSPLGHLYFDWKYVQSVVKGYLGRVPKFETYPRMSLSDMLRWAIIRRIRKVRPLYYLNSPKKHIKAILKDTYGWEDYGEIHHENHMTKLYHTVFCPLRLGFDQRKTYLAAQVRSGYLTRGEALAQLGRPQVGLDVLAELLGISDFELSGLMKTRIRHYTEFKTYKKTFERLRWLFWVLAKLGLVPWSFYTKYTKKGA